MEDLRYPIGRFSADAEVTDEKRGHWIAEIDRFPELLQKAVTGLSDSQLDTPYRPEGWTVRQVVHHLADSHMNAYVRFKLALTEDQPLAKTYDEARWAETEDARNSPLDSSLTLVRSLHQRWVRALRSLDAESFGRGLRHPEWGFMNLDLLLQIYAWHGRHHVAHIDSLRTRMGW